MQRKSETEYAKLAENESGLLQNSDFSSNGQFHVNSFRSFIQFRPGNTIGAAIKYILEINAW